MIPTTSYFFLGAWDLDFWFLFFTHRGRFISENLCIRLRFFFKFCLKLLCSLQSSPINQIHKDKWVKQKIEMIYHCVFLCSYSIICILKHIDKMQQHLNQSLIRRKHTTKEPHKLYILICSFLFPLLWVQIKYNHFKVGVGLIFPWELITPLWYTDFYWSKMIRPIFTATLLINN